MLADMKVRKYIRLLFSYLLLAFMAVIIVYPLLWTAGASFIPGNSLISTFRSIRHSIITRNYLRARKAFNMCSGMSTL